MTTYTSQKVEVTIDWLRTSAQMDYDIDRARGLYLAANLLEGFVAILRAREEAKPVMWLMEDGAAFSFTFDKGSATHASANNLKVTPLFAHPPTESADSGEHR